MLRKLMIGTVAAAGLMMAMGVSADAGCRPRGAYGPRGGFPGGPGYGYGGYGYGGGVVLAPRPVTAYPMYGYYPINYGYGPGFAYGGYGPGYGQAFGLRTGSFSMFLGR